MPAKISIFCKSLGKALGLEEREGIKSPVAVYPLSDTFLPLDNTSITRGEGREHKHWKLVDKHSFFYLRKYFLPGKVLSGAVLLRFGNLVCNKVISRHGVMTMWLFYSFIAILWPDNSIWWVTTDYLLSFILWPDNSILWVISDYLLSFTFYLMTW